MRRQRIFISPPSSDIWCLRWGADKDKAGALTSDLTCDFGGVSCPVCDGLRERIGCHEWAFANFRRGPYVLVHMLHILKTYAQRGIRMRVLPSRLGEFLAARDFHLVRQFAQRKGGALWQCSPLSVAL